MVEGHDRQAWSATMLLQCRQVPHCPTRVCMTTRTLHRYSMLRSCVLCFAVNHGSHCYCVFIKWKQCTLPRRWSAAWAITSCTAVYFAVAPAYRERVCQYMVERLLDPPTSLSTRLCCWRPHGSVTRDAHRCRGCRCPGPRQHAARQRGDLL